MCLHTILLDPNNDQRIIVAISAAGVFRSDDAGRSWTSISAGLPADFGFPIVAHPHRPGTIYVYPLVAGDERFPPGGRPAVWRSRDAGETWEEAGAGLPPEAWTVVLRDGFSSDRADPLGLYIGTRHGAIWASHDEGVGLAGVARTAGPFLVGWLVGWVLVVLVPATRSRPCGLLAGVLVWVPAVVVGMLVRHAVGDGVQTSFVVVTTIVLAVFLLGWRGAWTLVRRSRHGSRAHAEV